MFVYRNIKIKLSQVRSLRSQGDTRQTNVKHVVNKEHLPPESDDIDRTEQDKEQGQLDA